MTNSEPLYNHVNEWSVNLDAFYEWIKNKENVLSNKLSPEPTIKVLIFLALYESNKLCTYEDLRYIFAT